MCYEVADKIMPPRRIETLEDEAETIQEILLNQRLSNINSSENPNSKDQTNRTTSQKASIPPELKRK